MSKIITVHYTANGAPMTGLSPVIDIFKLDPVDPTSNVHVVVGGATTEIGLGFYRYDYVFYDPTSSYVFSFDGGSILSDCDRYKYGGNESYVEDISQEVWNEPAIAHTQAGSTGFVLQQIKADTTTIQVSEAAITTLITTLLKYERNRTKIDVAAAQLIIYDDDCITPLTTFDLRDFSGMPSVQEVCERVPQTC